MYLPHFGTKQVTCKRNQNPEYQCTVNCRHIRAFLKTFRISVTPGSDRLRETAVINNELMRLNMDRATLQETRLTVWRIQILEQWRRRLLVAAGKWLWRALLRRSRFSNEEQTAEHCRSTQQLSSDRFVPLRFNSAAGPVSHTGAVV